jgi:hypothetical protein
MIEGLFERPGLCSIEKFNHTKTIVEAVPGGLVIPKLNDGFSWRVESVNGSFLMPVVIISKSPKYLDELKNKTSHYLQGFAELRYD